MPKEENYGFSADFCATLFPKFLRKITKDLPNISRCVGVSVSVAGACDGGCTSGLDSYIQHRNTPLIKIHWN